MNFMLCDLEKGKEGVVLDFSGNGILFHRLQKFGFLPCLDCGCRDSATCGPLSLGAS